MKDVTIKNCWVKGMHTASLALLNSLLFMDTEYAFHELKDTCTIIEPFGSVLVFHPQTIMIGLK